MLTSGVRRPIYHGWWVLAACLVMLTVTSGLTFFSFTFYVTPMEESFGWSRTQTSVAAVINMLVFSVAAPLSGIWVDRRGVRSAMLGGAVFTALGFLLLSWTTALWQFYASWGLVAFARTWMTFIPAGILVSRWFRRRRGLALSVVSSGSAFGGIIVVPMLARMIDVLGWEGSYRLTSLIIPIAVIPLTLIVIRDRPEDRGLNPDGDEDEFSGQGPRPHEMEQTFTFREALHTRAFWMIAGAYLLFWMGTDSFQPHQAPFFESRGLDRDDVARILQVTSLMALGLRFGLLAFIDRVHGVRHLGAFTALCFAVAMAAVIVSTELTGLALFAFFYAVGQAGGPVVRPLLLSRYFGTVAMGALMGFGELMNVGGIFIGPILGGVLFDRTGSYDLALAFYAVSVLLSIPFFVLALPPRRRQGSIAEETVPRAATAGS